MGLDYPRLLASFCSGLLLAQAGSLIQATTQNELAGPSTLGLNAYMVLIILLVHSVSIVYLFPISVELAAFMVFLMVTFVFYLMAKNRLLKRHQVIANRNYGQMPFFLLLGLCFNLFVGAILGMMQFLFMSFDLKFPMQLWYGNFRFISPGVLIILPAVSILIFICLKRLGPQLRALSFGQDFALGLGVEVEKVQVQVFFLALVAVGTVDSFFGIFSFVGLIFPHLLRSVGWFRSNIEKELLWGGPLCGFLFLLLDFFCERETFYGSEIPAGLLSALIGTFLLLILLGKRRMTFFRSEG